MLVFVFFDAFKGLGAVDRTGKKTVRDGCNGVESVDGPLRPHSENEMEVYDPFHAFGLRDIRSGLRSCRCHTDKEQE